MQTTSSGNIITENTLVRRKQKRTSRRICVGAGLLAGLLLVLPSAADQVTLVENGNPRSVMVLPERPEPDEKLAAEELEEHLQLITGTKIERVEGNAIPTGKLPIYIGSAADTSLDKDTRAAGDNRSSFTLRVTEKRIDIRGLSDEGTLFGVYELLEQLGVRWYHPGELGRVIPESETLVLDLQDNTQAPSMKYRHLQWINAGNWRRRARLRVDKISTGRHGFPGDDVPRGTEGHQACLSGDYEPGALEAVTESIRSRHEPTDEAIYVSMGPHDSASGYCHCEGCEALDRGVEDPYYDKESMTDRYVWFFNEVLEALEEDYPNLHITFYAYSIHKMPPKRDPNPRLVPVFAPITLDRVRSMDNPMGPDRHVLRWLIDGWAESGVEEMYYRGYFNNLADPQLPFSQIDRVRNDIPALHEKGINVMRVEVINGGASWAMQTPHLYLATRMMWDVETDADAVLEEFYDRYYGPAAGPMQRYHERLESAFRDNPAYTGSAFLYFPLFLDHPRREEMRKLLAEATRLTGADNSAYAKRVRAVRMGWERMEAFLDTITARNRFDFKSARRHQERFYELSEALVNWTLEAEDGRPRNTQRMLAWRERPENGGSMYNRFFAPAIESGYERAVEAGEVAAGLPDKWSFLLDPQSTGKMRGLQRPGKLGGNWQTMRTKTRSWSDQGLHDYKGDAWYRTSVHIPAKYEGRKLYLWFAGVDEAVDVWINGEFVGSNGEPEEGLPGVPGAFKPFDLSATDAARPGEVNWVVVKAENRSLNELGTGGIMGPVMFWSPDDSDWQPDE